MRQHGALCMAASFENAFEIAKALEEVSKAAFDRAVKTPQVTLQDNTALLNALRNAAPGLHFSIEADAAVQAVAAKKKTLLPHLDDLSQIAGARILCAAKEPAAILKALKHSNAVLVTGMGAVCCAKDADDLDAIETIMRKSCMAALYADTCRATALSPIDRRIMRFVYTMKYAKKKTEH